MPLVELLTAGLLLRKRNPAKGGKLVTRHSQPGCTLKNLWCYERSILYTNIHNRIVAGNKIITYRMYICMHTLANVFRVVMRPGGCNMWLLVSEFKAVGSHIMVWNINAEVLVFILVVYKTNQTSSES